MALTDYQRRILTLLAGHRIERQESYLAGGAALTAAIDSPRFSMDIDLFHDTQEALLSTWEDDRKILAADGYAIEVRRQFPSFIEAFVRKGRSAVIVQWAVDSAFRFFPLILDPSSLPALWPQGPSGFTAGPSAARYPPSSIARGSPFRPAGDG